MGRVQKVRCTLVERQNVGNPKKCLDWRALSYFFVRPTIRGRPGPLLPPIRCCGPPMPWTTPMDACCGPAPTASIILSYHPSSGACCRARHCHTMPRCLRASTPWRCFPLVLRPPPNAPHAAPGGPPRAFLDSVGGRCSPTKSNRRWPNPSPGACRADSGCSPWGSLGGVGGRPLSRFWKARPLHDGLFAGSFPSSFRGNFFQSSCPERAQEAVQERPQQPLQ